MSGHTPGPWKVGAAGCRVVSPPDDLLPAGYVSQAEDTCILTLDDHEVVGCSEWMRMREEDARLIAAAPALLAALRGLVAWHSGDDGDGDRQPRVWTVWDEDDGRRLAAAIDAAIDAIANTEGRS